MTTTILAYMWTKEPTIILPQNPLFFHHSHIHFPQTQPLTQPIPTQVQRGPVPSKSLRCCNKGCTSSWSKAALASTLCLSMTSRFFLAKALLERLLETASRGNSAKFWGTLKYNKDTEYRIMAKLHCFLCRW